MAVEIMNAAQSVGDTKTNAGTLREHEETAAPFLLELV